MSDYDCPASCANCGADVDKQPSVLCDECDDTTEIARLTKERDEAVNDYGAAKKQVWKLTGERDEARAEAARQKEHNALQQQTLQERAARMRAKDAALLAAEKEHDALTGKLHKAMAERDAHRAERDALTDVYSQVIQDRIALRTQLVAAVEALEQIKQDTVTEDSRHGAAVCANKLRAQVKDLQAQLEFSRNLNEAQELLRNDLQAQVAQAQVALKAAYDRGREDGLTARDVAEVQFTTMNGTMSAHDLIEDYNQLLQCRAAFKQGRRGRTFVTPKLQKVGKDE